MRHIHIALALLLCAHPAPGQQSVKKLERYVKVPPKNTLVLLAQQPACPLRIEEASFFLRDDASGSVITNKVRNVSSKPIRFFRVVAYSSYGTGGPLGNATLNSEAIILPGDVFDVGVAGKTFEVVPMTAKVRDTLNSESGMKAFWVLMVVQVVFVDGTVYNETNVADELLKLLQHRPD